MERETTPSQSEWLIMEVFWANDTPTMTAKEVPLYRSHIE